MKKSLLIAPILLLSACATPLPGVGPGAIFTETTEAVSANNNIPSTRRGEACATNILGIVSTGDSTVDTAKRQGGITRVSSIDRSFYSILGVYAKACTIISGN
ncbi:MAG: TRL-like family protein [bacterium]|nr:TRL-like family protein [bacterium]